MGGWNNNMWSLENFTGINKIEAMLFKVSHPLVLVPFIPHGLFYIQNVYKYKVILGRMPLNAIKGSVHIRTEIYVSKVILHKGTKRIIGLHPLTLPIWCQVKVKKHLSLY
jgi:hypothetical protein